MANSDKNIIIRPRTGSTSNPVLEFIGASSILGPQTITATVTSANQGTVTFSGPSGTIFTMADNAASKLSVNGSMSSTGGFVGDLTGNATTATTATNATNVTVTISNTSSAFKVPFVNTTGSINANYGLLHDSTATFTYNPSTNTLVAGTFSGALSGTASVATTVTLVATSSTSATHYINFTDAATGNENIRTDTNLTYNPGTNTLVAGTFSGNLSGNVTGIISASDGSSAAPGIRFTSDTNTGFYRSATDAISVTTGGTIAATFEADGDFVATGDVTAFSDRRLKTNINTVEGALDLVNQLRGVRFEKGGRAGIGVIAQEIEEILPEVVNNSGEYKSVAYGNIVGVLIEAIKELSAEIEELKKDRQ